MFFFCKSARSNYVVPLVAKKQPESWNLLPENVQIRIIEYLTPKEKGRLSSTSKSNYDIVKKVPTYIHWLSFCPFRHNGKRRTAEVLIYFDEQKLKSYVFTFEKIKDGKVVFIEKDDKKDTMIRFPWKGDYIKAANDCFEGVLTNAKVHTLDIRGEYTGKLPSKIEVTNLSITDKYTLSTTAIPAWLDAIPEGEIHFMLMSDHWDRILSHKHFSNPMSTCQLTGYDGIGYEDLSQICCRQIKLNHIKDERSFNYLAKKWSAGNLPQVFDWLIATSATRLFNIEKLLEDLKVEELNGNIFEDNDRTSGVVHYLVSGSNGQYAVFSGVANFARISVINAELIKEYPQLQSYLDERIKKLVESRDG